MYSKSGYHLLLLHIFDKKLQERKDSVQEVKLYKVNKPLVKIKGVSTFFESQTQMNTLKYGSSKSIGQR